MTSRTMKTIELAHEPLEKFQITLWKYLGLLALTVIPMALINLIFGFPGSFLNLSFLFAGVFLISFVGFSPKLITLSAIIGMAANDLADKDRSQGAIDGIKMQQTIVFIVLLAYCDVVMLLSVIPFGKAMWAIPFILAAACIVAIAGALLGTGSTFLTWSYRINLVIMVGMVIIALGMNAKEPITETIDNFSRTDVRMNSVTKVTHEVALPRCPRDLRDMLPAEKWPARVPRPPHKNMEWTWPEAEAMYYRGGKWYTHEPGTVIDGADMFLFCTDYPDFVGKLMPLFWS